MDFDVDPEEHMATAADLLLEHRNRQAAALLLDVESLEYEYVTRLERVDAFDAPPAYKVEAHLRVPTFLYERFTDDVCEAIRSALEDAAYADRLFVSDVAVHPASSAVEWRERVSSTLGTGPTNQATLMPVGDDITEDRMRFRDKAELAVYRALKKAQAKAPKGDSVLIAPNPSVFIANRTWEPDFLVTYRGRAGVIEVDGATHRGRAAHDRSRDRIYEDAGIHYTDRISVEDAEDEDAVYELVARFLRRLARP